MIWNKAIVLIVPALMHCSILAAATAAESGQQPKFGDYQTKGFLSDYSRLKLRDGTEDTFVFQDPNTDFSQYDKLMVERIKVWFKDDAAYKGIDPAEIKDLTDYFHNAIVEAIGDRYPVVREPGPDVLRLRIAMTDLVVPFLWVAEAGSGVATGDTGSTPFVGEVTIELEALDSQSNRQVAAFIERKIGLRRSATISTRRMAFRPPKTNSDTGRIPAQFIDTGEILEIRSLGPPRPYCAAQSAAQRCALANAGKPGTLCEIGKRGTGS